MNVKQSLGNRYTTYLTSSKNQRIYNRKEINKHTTEFYAHSYVIDEDMEVEKTGNQEQKSE